MQRKKNTHKHSPYDESVCVCVLPKQNINANRILMSSYHNQMTWNGRKEGFYAHKIWDVASEFPVIIEKNVRVL